MAGGGGRACAATRIQGLTDLGLALRQPAGHTDAAIGKQAVCQTYQQRRNTPKRRWPSGQLLG